MQRNIRRVTFPSSSFSQRMLDRARKQKAIRQATYTRGRASLAPFGRGAITEVKSLDVNDGTRTIVNFATVAGAATLASGMMCLNPIVQGAEFYHRVGLKVTAISLNVRFVVAGTVPNSVRYLIVFDRQTNKAFPALTDVLAINATGTGGFSSNPNLANASRFSILRDRTLCIDVAQQEITVRHEYLKLRLNSEYTATAGAIADITTGSLLFIVFYDETTYATPPTINNFVSRVRYMD